MRPHKMRNRGEKIRHEGRMSMLKDIIALSLMFGAGYVACIMF